MLFDWFLFSVVFFFFLCYYFFHFVNFLFVKVFLIGFIGSSFLGFVFLLNKTLATFLDSCLFTLLWCCFLWFFSFFLRSFLNFLWSLFLLLSFLWFFFFNFSFLFVFLRFKFFGNILFRCLRKLFVVDNLWRSHFDSTSIRILLLAVLKWIVSFLDSSGIVVSSLFLLSVLSYLLD